MTRNGPLMFSGGVHDSPPNRPCSSVLCPAAVTVSPGFCVPDTPATAKLTTLGVPSTELAFVSTLPVLAPLSSATVTVSFASATWSSTARSEERRVGKRVVLEPSVTVYVTTGNATLKFAAGVNVYPPFAPSVSVLLRGTVHVSPKRYFTSAVSSADLTTLGVPSTELAFVSTLPVLAPLSSATVTVSFASATWSSTA